MLKEIPEYEGIYWISPEGEITSKYRSVPLAGWVEATGYRAVSLWKDGKSSRATVHTLLAKVYLPNPSNLPEVNHIDGNKLNNSLDNLEWVKCVDNIRHAFTNGLTKNAAAIDYTKIPELLNEVMLGSTLRDLARREGVKESSTLRKLLLREAIRQGKEAEFIKGTEHAKETLVSENSHSVIQKTLEGKHLAKFPSINAAARFVGKNPASVFKAIKYNRQCAGYLWEKEDA